MSKLPTKFDSIINEKASACYTTTLTDENGVAIPSGSIDTLTLTLSNVDDGTIVNSRDGQDVLNLNNVTVTSGGLLTYTIQPLDTVIVDNTKDYETHRATFEMNFNSGVSYGNWDVDLMIRNLSKVT